MALQKVLGIETEYGIIARNLDVTPTVASSLLVNAYGDEGLALRVWDFLGETPHLDARGDWVPEGEYPHVESLMANAVLTNGARYYVDHAHPELSTPECASPSQVVLHDRAGELIIAESMRRALARLPLGSELVAYKNNSDGKGNSYGCHENYLVSREVPFGRVQTAMLAHLVSRQVFCGSGKVGVEMPRQGEPRPWFQLSQRADFFEEEVGLETTIRRPIVNTRDEPHANPARYRRLHVIAGDANMSQVATWLKVGTTALVLSCVEDGMFPDGLRPVDPVAAVRAVSHDISLGTAVETTDGRHLTALEIQFGILSAVRRWLEVSDDDTVAGESARIIREWQSVLDGLASDPGSVADTVDWVAKHRLVDAYARRHALNRDDPRLRAIDLQYHDMRPDRSLSARSGLRTLVDDEAAGLARSEPPADTRAWFRGACIARWPDRVVSANWDGIVFDTQDGLVRVPMEEPLKGTRHLVGGLLSASATVEELLERLGPRSSEPVEVDPGW
ncbi:MAG: depupylase/deamidase Dop [Ilumatobacteraceae bacterium]